MFLKKVFIVLILCLFSCSSLYAQISATWSDKNAQKIKLTLTPSQISTIKARMRIIKSSSYRAILKLGQKTALEQLLGPGKRIQTVIYVTPSDVNNGYIIINQKDIAR